MVQTPARKKEYEKEYSNRPEVKQKKKERMRKYMARPEQIEKRKNRSEKYFIKQREKIHAILGHSCITCGFSDKRALQIDHINGGGSKERQSFGAYQYYKYVLSLPEAELKSKYQILCANCNAIKKVVNREKGSGKGKP